MATPGPGDPVTSGLPFDLPWTSGSTLVGTVQADGLLGVAPGSLTAVLVLMLAGTVAGAVNAAAGGGSLLTYPTLLAAGLDPFTANVTNTVGLVPGYLGGLTAFHHELVARPRRSLAASGVAAVGAVIGCILLLRTDPDVFAAVVPWLVLAAAGLLAVQPRVSRWLARRDEATRGDAGAARESAGGVARPRYVQLGLSLLACGVYGAYFGAAVGVMTLALLALALPEPLDRLNGLKLLVSLTSNLLAAIVFAVSAPVMWPAAGALAVGSLAGGRLGGVLVRRVDARTLRAGVVVIATVVGLIMLVD